MATVPDCVGDVRCLPGLGAGRVLDGAGHVGTGLLVQLDTPNALSLWLYGGLRKFHFSAVRCLICSVLPRSR
jgi:hypothetical protein